VDRREFGDTCFVQALKSADPQLQIGVNGIFYHYRNVDTFQCVGHILNREWVHRGARSDPKNINTGFQTRFHVGGIGNFGRYRQACLFLRLH
jgi:hypothetical protein